jgi:hypothetical protein
MARRGSESCARRCRAGARLLAPGGRTSQHRGDCPPSRVLHASGPDATLGAASETTISWPAILAAVDAEQQRLGTLVADLAAGKSTSPLTDAERFNLVLGITCHAIYHSGQIQLIKRLAEG